ncbi:hypothetical protein DRJ19_04880 [Candidatus Woesearchaeota archaeon]|nr:MAG: hypothetical protein DRJ19_04880 [Candidatus Woesearchaeota archaeon]
MAKVKVVQTVDERARLTQILKKYAEQARKLSSILSDTSRKALDEAMRETDIHRLLSPLHTPILLPLSKMSLNALSDGVAKGVYSSRDIYEYILQIVDEASYDQGEVNFAQSLTFIADPEVIKKYSPEIKTALTEPSSALYTILKAFRVAAYSCGDKVDIESDFLTCVADKLERYYGELERHIKEINQAELKKELKELYTAVLKHGKERGLEEAIRYF